MTPRVGTLVLDAQGLSGWLANDSRVLDALAFAQTAKADIVMSAMTVIEASHGKTDGRRLDWLLSRARVVPVTAASARAAGRRLVEAGVHGHSHAIDAVVAELASRQPKPVAVLTSDPDDLRLLCDPHVRVVRV